jgi:hypothetical protein
VFDAIAVLIAVVTLGQLPFGLSVGAAASVLILGPQGVAAAAAAGVLLTATGTAGGLLFASWGALDIGLSRPRVKAFGRRGWARVAHLGAPAGWPWAAFGALASQLWRSVERTCFDLVGHLQIGPMLLPAYGPGLPAGAPLAAMSSRRRPAPSALHRPEFAQFAGRESGKTR